MRWMMAEREGNTAMCQALSHILHSFFFLA